MAVGFDTLGYATALERGGVPRDEAEAHANAAREFIMKSLATKADLKHTEERITDRLTIRLGSIVVLGVTVTIAALSLILKT